MRQEDAKKVIGKFRKRRLFLVLMNIFLLSVAVAVVIAALARQFFEQGLMAFLISFSSVFIGCLIYSSAWRLSDLTMASMLDQQFPELEESSTLLFRDLNQLTFLEKLQVEKVAEVMDRLQHPALIDTKFKKVICFLLIAVAFSLWFIHLPLHPYGSSSKVPDDSVAGVSKTGEKLPALVAAVQLQIDPPPYTRKSRRLQSGFSFVAESGAQIKWQLRTSVPVEKLSFLFNDQQEIPLRQLNREKTRWSFSKRVEKNGFYQVIMDGKRSDLYQLEVVPDRPVAIQILRPTAYKTIDIGAVQQLNLDVVMKDDYGIEDAFIAATLASGKGESVTFKEKKLPFDIHFDHHKEIHATKIVPLQLLGMKPGGELYYEVHARDNHGQWSRSGMHFISIQDTTELMSMAGMDSGVSLVPEYFRSQRQLIIDTEKLLKEKASISETAFKDRSNDLGADQKMLRLRYGRFLGEESETAIGEEGSEHHDEHDHVDSRGAAGGAAAVMGQYAHQHDQAEDATFFEPDQKAKLKATLTEMWNAELRLRTYVPQQALPFEYKALRLLKDLQQQSRVYVAKTTFKPNVLKLEKRLTGDLTAVKTGVSTGKAGQKDNRLVVLKKTLALLERMKDNNRAAAHNSNRTVAETDLLLQSERYLIAAAAVHPQQYLPFLKAFKAVAGGRMQKNVKGDREQEEKSLNALLLAQRGLSMLIGNEEPLPKRTVITPAEALANSYFQQLKRLIVENGK